MTTTRERDWRRGLWAVVLVALVAGAGHGPLRGQVSPPPREADHPHVAEADLRRWLTTLSSDAMGGRAAFTEGYGLAAAYVAGELAGMGVEPLGIDGTYLQPVTRTTYRVTRKASVTVRTPAGTRTFEHDDHVVFPLLAGGRQTREFQGVEFIGYGLPDGGADARAARIGSRLVLLLPGMPTTLQGRQWPYPRALTSIAGRADALIAEGAGGVIGYSAAPPGRAGGPARASRSAAELVTVRRVDRVRPPSLTGDDAFFEFLLAGAAVSFNDLRLRASRGEPLDTFALPDVHVSIDVDYTYDAVTAERTHNVVGIVRGTDAALRDTFVLFGAHLDHVGTALGNQVPGRANVAVAQDPIWNGADDDGSGSSALLAIAKAMSAGPRPRRSTLFVWHGGEEEGLLGSEAMADQPVVPLAQIQAVFNIDMIGRNKDDNPEDANTVYVVGADRISTDLHNAIVEANGAVVRPLALDYFYNDPNDTESFYTRSDHYSYASQGIPAAFFFTGPHADYHANTDTADKILFPKLARITELIYAAGFHVANRVEPLRRDQRGPRSGRGFTGLLPVP